MTTTAASASMMMIIIFIIFITCIYYLQFSFVMIKNTSESEAQDRCALITCPKWITQLNDVDWARSSGSKGWPDATRLCEPNNLLTAKLANTSDLLLVKR